MQINKTYLVVGGLLLAMAGGTAFLVLKAPSKPGTGAASAEPEGLSKPRGLAFDKEGRLLIVDSKHHRIVAQNPDGSLHKRFGRQGTAKGEFREPCGIAVGPKGDIYVADTFHTLDPAGGLPWGRIQRFSAGYRFQAVLPKPGEGPTDFFGPRAVAVDPEGRVWVSDTGHHRLVIYAADGGFLRSLGGRGKGDLEFEEPFGIAFDAQGNAYVADRLNFRVQVIGKDFRLVRQFKVDAWESVQINMEPYLALDAGRGTLWVSDPTKARVHAYGLDGKKKATYTQGQDLGATVAFVNPTGLALDKDGTLHISDGGLGRILTLKP